MICRQHGKSCADIGSFKGIATRRIKAKHQQKSLDRIVYGIGSDHLVGRVGGALTIYTLVLVHVRLQESVRGPWKLHEWLLSFSENQIPRSDWGYHSTAQHQGYRSGHWRDWTRTKSESEPADEHSNIDSTLMIQPMLWTWQGIRYWISGPG